MPIGQLFPLQKYFSWTRRWDRETETTAEETDDILLFQNQRNSINRRNIRNTNDLQTNQQKYLQITKIHAKPSNQVIMLLSLLSLTSNLEKADNCRQWNEIKHISKNTMKRMVAKSPALA